MLDRAGALLVTLLWVGILSLTLPPVAWADNQAPAVPPALTLTLIVVALLVVVSVVISVLTLVSVRRSIQQFTDRLAETRETYATRADLEAHERRVAEGQESRNRTLDGWMLRMDRKIDEMRDEQAVIRKLLE